MKNWIPKNKSLKFALLAMFLSVALYFTGVFMVTREAKKIEDFYRNSESELSKNERLLAVKSLAAANKESIDDLRRFFIQKGDEVEFIERIEQVAKASSVEFDIVSIDVRLNPNDTFKEDIDVKMTVEGSWANVMRFVGALEKMPFGVLVQGTNLNAGEAGSWEGYVEFIVFREK